MSAPGPKVAERRTVCHPGALSFGDFSLREQRKVTLGQQGVEHPALFYRIIAGGDSIERN
jgi:hypothetical protein